MKSFLVFVSGVAALTTGVGKRDASTLNNSTATIVLKIQAFADVATNYTGGTLPAISVYTADKDLQDALQQGIDAAHTIQNPPISADDEGLLAPHLMPIVPKSQAALKALKDKRDLLVAANVSNIVKTALSDTKTANDLFADAVTAVLPAAENNFAVQYKAALDAAYQDAIDYFDAI